MKHFNYVAPNTVEEASKLVKEGNTMLSAGATDIIGVLKEKILPTYPDTLVSLKNIAGLDTIEEKEDGLHIGAMATLSNIASSEVVKAKWQAVADSAYSVASPNIRTTATIGGNICQDIRCWYYRYPNEIGGNINCARKEGHLCSAIMGENRYHSIFGAAKVSVTPCTNKCPAKTDISAYMELYRAGDIEAAARVIMEVNPMPAITSRVCAHFCMEGCNRNTYDECVNIGAVERNIGDYILANHAKFMTAPKATNGKRVSIVGSGPSGLTAAYYLRQSGYEVTIYEKKAEAGGCLMYAIPAYRLPKDIVRNFTTILEDMGVEIKCNVNVGKDITIEELYAASESVMIDTGTWERPLIGLKGEEMTKFGLDFLVDIGEYIGGNIGNKVVVVGGGNVAMDVAITAKRLGVEDVKMLCLEDRAHMPANQEEIDRALEENVEIINMWGPKKIVTEGKMLKGIEFKKCLRVLDETGRFNPEYDEENILALDADIVIMAIGQRSDTSFLDGAFAVDTVRGRITTDELSNTSVEGIFASGDITTGPSTVIQAIANGKKTAKGINNYCGGDKLVVESVEQARLERNTLTFDSKTYSYDSMNKQELIDTSKRGLEVEDLSALTNEQTLNETNRCFNCGCLAVNPSDTANMLLALDAKFVTNMRTLTAVELLSRKTKIADVLANGEILLEIVVPNVTDTTVMAYDKYRTRKSIDFAILAIASQFDVVGGVVRKARLVMGAVAPVPMRAYEAEKHLLGKQITAELAHECAELALKGAIALQHNQYKIDMCKQMIVDAIMGATK